MFDALRAGASGFLLKDVTAERLFYAVRVVAAGEALLARAVTRRLISEFVRLRPRPGARPRPRWPRSSLGSRSCCGSSRRACPNPEIAARLLVSDETVKTHVSRVPGKLRLRDWTQAVITPYETGLVVPHSG